VCLSCLLCHSIVKIGLLFLPPQFPSTQSSMSFLPSDLASWALRSVRTPRNAADETNTESNQQQQSSQIQQQVDEQDVRAKRLARLSAAAAAATSSETTPMPGPSVDTVMTDVDAMEVEPPSSSDKESTVVSVVAPMEVDDIPETPPSITPTSNSSNSKRKSSVTPSTTASGAGAERRRRRKKEMLVQKILRISLLGGCLSTSVSSESAAPCVVVDIGPDPIIVDQNISEVLATRLALSSDALAHVPVQVNKNKNKTFASVYFTCCISFTPLSHILCTFLYHCPIMNYTRTEISFSI